MSKDTLRLLVEKSLESAWDGQVVLEAGEVDGLSGRGHVHRFRVRSAPAGTPPSVVVKQPRQNEDERFDARSDDPATAMFFNEWACLQLLTEVRSEPPSPRMYCGNADRGFLVMEDFGSGERLDHALLGSDPVRATQTLAALFETVGQMHAATFGKRSRFEAIQDEHGRKRKRQQHQHDTQKRHQAAIQKAIQDALARLELRPHHSFFDEVEEIRSRIDSADEFQALIHGDPCPDNCHWVGNRVRLLDFEHGRFGNAFSDGCYPCIHFPTCWCVSRLPDEVVHQALEAYRRELARGAPSAASGQLFERGMVEASVQWAWLTFGSWHMPDVLEQDREWGLVTVRQRILFRFRLLLDMMERNGWYPGITATTRESHEVLSARWHDVADMPLYPAFR